ncbi:MAG: CvpA family protein [Planctomycetota bacterium]
MPVYDVAILILLLMATLMGAVRGFAWQLVSIGSILISVAFATNYRDAFSQNIDATPPWNRILALLILMLGAWLAIWTFTRVLRGVIDRMRLREFDRQMGSVFGLAKGLMIAFLATVVAAAIPNEWLRQRVLESRSGAITARVFEHTRSLIPEELASQIQPVLQRVDAPPQMPRDDSNTPGVWLATDENRAHDGQNNSWNQTLHRGYPASQATPSASLPAQAPQPHWQTVPSTARSRSTGLPSPSWNR